jgi:fluoroacetyl-CoA thioesterase
MDEQSMSNVTVGASASMERLIESKYCTERFGHEIFSTPNLVLLLEETAIKALAPFLRADQACVGSTIEIAHTAPTLRGQHVTATATVAAVDRRRIQFDVEARDELDNISKGTHERFIVDQDKLAARLGEKANKLGAERGNQQSK